MNQINILNQQPTPDNLMWNIWTSIYHLAALTAADELDLFSYLNDHEHTIEQIAYELKADVRPTSVLVNLLINLGFLNINANKISLTLTAKNYLIPESLFYWGSVLYPFRERIEHKKVINAIKQKSNQLTFDNKSFTDMWQEGSLTPDAARSFTEKMHATIFAPALEAIKLNLFASTKNLLDVGGGSGCFSIAFSQAYPERTAVVFELPTVCEITKKYISEFNADKNVSVHSGNFFTNEHWPRNCDGILFSQILHDWPIEKCTEILKHAHSAMPSGGVIYVHEMMLDDSKASPLATVCFDLLMLINHRSQQFSKHELHSLLKECGFSDPLTTYTFGYFSITTATKL
jgi:hypothetical protein